jgi:hypothetical protein
MLVTGVQVNGYIFNIVSPTSTFSSSTNALSSSIPVVTSTISSEPKHNDDRGTIPTGAVVGVAIGAAILGVAVSCIIGWFILRRYRRNALHGPQKTELRSGESQPVFMSGPGPGRSEMATVEGAQELYGTQIPHELLGARSSQL